MGQTGKHLLGLSLAGFDPIRTSATPHFCDGLSDWRSLGGDFGQAFLRAGLVPIAAFPFAHLDRAKLINSLVAPNPRATKKPVVIPASKRNGTIVGR